MKDILTAPFMKELESMTDNMYRLGWNERNGGNISMLLEEEQISPYIDCHRVIRTLPVKVAIPELVGRYFLVTGTGKYFKNISKNPEDALGIIRIVGDGSEAELLWGYQNGGSFTSEIVMHLGAHLERMRSNPKHRVIMHAHPTNTIAMTHVHNLEEKEFSKTLWRMCTECIVIFPEGVSVLPWMVSSHPGIGLASAEKFKDYRILIWALHGCTVAGDTLDEAFGLMETVEKGAEIYMKIQSSGYVTGIDDASLKQVAEAFDLKVREGWL